MNSDGKPCTKFLVFEDATHVPLKILGLSADRNQTFRAFIRMFPSKCTHASSVKNKISRRCIPQLAKIKGFFVFWRFQFLMR